MQQKITISNKKGEKLVGVLHEAGSSEQLVVLCHGFESSKESETIASLALRLESEGISAFRFDFSGSGESEGPFNYGNYWSEVEDLRAVVEYFNLENRHTVTVVGHSRGITNRLGVDYMDRLKKEGYIDFKTKTGTYQVTEKSMMERLNTDMQRPCLSIDEKCRVLTVHGKSDSIIPKEDASKFGKIIPNHRLQIIKGANHGYTSKLNELASVVLPFVKESMPRPGADQGIQA